MHRNLDFNFRWSDISICTFSPNSVLLFSSNFRIWRKKFREGGKKLGLVGRSGNQNHTYFFLGLTSATLNQVKDGKKLVAILQLMGVWNSCFQNPSESSEGFFQQCSLQCI